MNPELALTYQQRRIWLRLYKMPSFDREVVIAKGASTNNAGSFLFRLKELGLVEEEVIDRHRSIYRPISRPVPIDQEVTPQGNMWRSMRTLKTFTAKDIAAHSNAGGVSISAKVAGGYCGLLKRAGILREVKPGQTVNKAKTYRLIHDLGPAAPKVERIYVLVDPNSGDLFVDDQRVTP